jgi:hypothetical protein
MKRSLLALLLALAASSPGAGAYAATYAPQEFDFSQLEGGSAGVVERACTPDLDLASAMRFVVRLDNGFAIEAIGEGLDHFEPGQRVRVLPRARLARE